MKIFIYHPYSKDNPVSSLAADYSAAVTTVKIKNTNGFATNKYAVLGSIGFEQAELVQTSTVTPPDTLAGFTTVFPHNADSNVTLFDYNQINIYRSTTGINGTYSILATVNIQIDNDTTPYEDTTSQSTYYYKYSYFNAAASVESSLSDPIAATGFVWYSLKTLIDRILSLFGDMKSEFVQRYEVADYLNEFLEKAQRKVAVATKRVGVTWGVISLISGIDEYDLFGDFLVEKGVKFSEDGGVNYPYSGSNKNVDSMGRTQATNVKYDYSIYGTKVKLDPMPQTTGELMKIYYVPSPILLQLQTDTLPMPFQNATGMFVKYGLGMCKLKDNKDDWGNLTKLADNQLEEFVTFIKQTQSRHPQFSELLGRSG